MAQKISQKLTRKQKNIISMERWAILNELKKAHAEIEKAIETLMSGDVSNYSEFRRQFKSIQNTKAAVTNFLSKKLNIKTATLLDFSKVARPKMIITPLNGLLGASGVTTSIWNNIQKAPEGWQYWMEVLEFAVKYVGADVIKDAWIQAYFDSGAFYEDEGLGFQTKSREGYDVLVNEYYNLAENLADFDPDRLKILWPTYRPLSEA